METHCSFAHAGTYGHECGSPATEVGIVKSDITANGIYYARRCASCRAIKGGENARITQWTNFDPKLHANQWQR